MAMHTSSCQDEGYRSDHTGPEKQENAAEQDRRHRNASNDTPGQERRASTQASEQRVPHLLNPEVSRRCQSTPTDALRPGPSLMR